MAVSSPHIAGYDTRWYWTICRQINLRSVITVNSLT